LVRTWCDGNEATFRVLRGERRPFEISLIGSRKVLEGHGTEIQSVGNPGMLMTAADAREVIGARFLADPNFKVAINGTKVTFDDIPAGQLREIDVEVQDHGVAHLIVIDTLKADRTTRQHGIAWIVNNRVVGNPGWLGFDQERFVDGRSSEAKRFIFIVRADFLADTVLPDWSAFDTQSPSWRATQTAVHDCIRAVISEVSADRRREAKEVIRENLGHAVAKLSPVGRDRWNTFVDKVVDTCPTIPVDTVEQVASVLAKLELASSKYELIAKLHDMKPGDLDELNAILVDWTVRTAKLALDEIASRLKLIEELDEKLRDPKMDEVGDLQPLFERSLWVFGPEFESLEFTSNRGMTEVIARIFGKKETMGSRLRPDFVMLPDGSVGFYSRDSHDFGGEVDGVARLVIAEIKKPGVTISGEEKNQPWRYIQELLELGLLTNVAKVTCYVLGSRIKSSEAYSDTKLDGRVTIIPMTYETFVRRAAKRMLGLRDKLCNAPFLRAHGVDADEFLKIDQPRQASFDLRDA
jgi:DNA-directed RNA polymerase subunit F